MRVLIVGTGSIGLRHMRNLQEIVPGVKFDVLRGSQRPATPFPSMTCTFSGTLEEALSKVPELVVIANPSGLHFQYLLAAIKEKIPFYVEKPIVSNRQDLKALAQVLNTTSAPVNLVGCNLRFMPSLQRLKQLIDAGAVGRVARASLEAGQWLPDWRPSRDYRESYSARRNLGGGVALDLIHEVDVALWLFGSFDSVLGQAVRSSRLEIDTEDCACLLLARSGGPIAVVQIDYVSRKAVRRYQVVGDEGTAEWELAARTLLIKDAKSSRQIELQDGAFDVDATYVSAMRELIQAISDGRPTVQPLEEGIKALDVTFRALSTPLE